MVWPWLCQHNMGSLESLKWADHAKCFPAFSFSFFISPGCDLPSSYALRGVLCQGLVQSCCPCEASVHPCEMLLLRNTPGCSLQLPVVPGTAAGQSGFGGAVRQPWEAGLEQALSPNFPAPCSPQG